MSHTISGLFLPERIGRYQIVARLGAGGMADVLLAFREGAAGFRRAVAIKRVLPQYARDRAFVRMLQREAAIAALARHPNCLHVEEFEEVEGQFYLVTELLVGISVDRLAASMAEAGRPFPIAAAAQIGLEAARALDHIHNLTDASGTLLHVIHRDVSPHNLFVTDQGSVKLLDFGIAKAADALDSTTRSGVLKGKFAYMSPEQYGHQSLDARSDLWALGVTLWELTTDMSLFSRSGLLDSMKAVREAPILAPSTIRAGVPKDLDALVMQLLERVPAARPSTAREVAGRLEGIVRDGGGAAGAGLASLVLAHARADVERLRLLASGVVPESEPTQTESTVQTTVPSTVSASTTVSSSAGRTKRERPSVEMTTEDPRLGLQWAATGSADPSAAARRWPMDLLAVALGIALGLLVAALLEV